MSKTTRADLPEHTTIQGKAEGDETLVGTEGMAIRLPWWTTGASGPVGTRYLLGDRRPGGFREMRPIRWLQCKMTSRARKKAVAKREAAKRKDGKGRERVIASRLKSVLGDREHWE